MNNVFVAILVIAAVIYFTPGLCQQRLWFVPSYWDYLDEAKRKTSTGKYYSFTAADDCSGYSYAFDAPTAEIAEQNSKIGCQRAHKNCNRHLFTRQK